MTRKIGLILSCAAAFIVIAAGAYSYACDGSSCSSAKKAANANTSCSADAKTASNGGACCQNKGAAAEKATMTAGASCSAGAKTASNGAGCCMNKGASAEKANMTAGASCSADAKTASNGAGCCMNKGASAEKANMTAGASCSAGAKTASNGGACCMSKTASADKATCASKMAASSCGSKGYYAANVYDSKEGHMWAVAQGKKFEVTDKTPYTQVGDARYYFADDNCKISCQEKMKTASLDIDKETVSLATAEGNIVGTEDGKKIAQCRVSGQKFVVTADSPARVMDGQKIYFCGPGCCNMSKETSSKETSLNAQ